MLYFIPAWYKQNSWRESEQNWYSVRTRTEFDDTVKHVQLFHRSKVYPYQIMLLSYAPNFRHFLHRQSIFHAPYWSCFDAIQEVERKKVSLFSFHSLNWPKHIEFVYTPFVIVAMLNGQKYAQIEFGEDGNMIQIDIYKDGVLQRRNIYDDRGFVSSTIIYDDRGMLYQDYLTDKGIWKIREYQDGHVEINSKSDTYLIKDKNQETVRKFKKNVYESISEVICEVTATYVQRMSANDILCVAMHQLNNEILNKVLNNKRCIFSFYEKRYDILREALSKDLMKKAAYVITDYQNNYEAIKKVTKGRVDRVVNITPFDSRVDFGISSQLNVQKIMVPVDGIGEESFEQLIRYLGEYLFKNKDAQIHLFTRRPGNKRKNDLLQMTRQYIKKYGYSEEWALDENQNKKPTDLLNDTEYIPTRFFVEQCVDELSVSKCIREQRIVVDMRSETELYLRITGISVGIPQIVYAQTEFVEDGKNGMLIKEFRKLPEAIGFYLDSLKNWNDAMVYSYELGKNYTTEVLIDKWKEVIEFVERN